MTETDIAEITVNGERRRLAGDDSVTALVAELTGREIGPDGRAVDGQRLGVAVARNAGVVPRSQWAVTTLLAGDDIEIVTAVQGG